MTAAFGVQVARHIYLMLTTQIDQSPEEMDSPLLQWLVAAEVERVRAGREWGAIHVEKLCRLDDSRRR